jgi:hypothetical protein
MAMVQLMTMQRSLLSSLRAVLVFAQDGILS